MKNRLLFLSAVLVVGIVSSVYAARRVRPSPFTFGAHPLAGYAGQLADDSAPPAPMPLMDEDSEFSSLLDDPVK
jgi:hypothetical protein